MPQIPKINCKYYSEFGNCMHPDKLKVFFGLLKDTCIYLKHEQQRHGGCYTPIDCEIQKKYPRPLPPAHIPKLN